MSPYAKRGHIDHTNLDFTSEVKFIERNWGLAPLASRDGAARSLDSAFDFSSPPRAPRILAAARGGRPQAKPRTLPIYLLYGGAVLLTLILIAFGLVRSRPALGVAANEGGPRA